MIAITIAPGGLTVAREALERAEREGGAGFAEAAIERGDVFLADHFGGPAAARRAARVAMRRMDEEMLAAIEAALGGPPR